MWAVQTAGAMGGLQSHLARVDTAVWTNKLAIDELKRDDRTDDRTHDAISDNIEKLSDNMNMIFKRLGQVESLVFALQPYKAYRSKIDDTNALAVLANKFGNRDVLRLDPVGGVFDEKSKYEPLEFHRSSSSSSDSSSNSGRDSSRSSDYGSVTARFREKK